MLAVVVGGKKKPKLIPQLVYTSGVTQLAVKHLDDVAEAPAGSLVVFLLFLFYFLNLLRDMKNVQTTRWLPENKCAATNKHILQEGIPVNELIEQLRLPFFF